MTSHNLKNTIKNRCQFCLACDITHQHLSSLLCALKIIFCSLYDHKWHHIVKNTFIGCLHVVERNALSNQESQPVQCDHKRSKLGTSISIAVYSVLGWAQHTVLRAVFHMTACTTEEHQLTERLLSTSSHYRYLYQNQELVCVVT